MIKRWDNASHWKGLKTFPYHIRLGYEVEPKESPEVFILPEIDKILGVNN